ncbi:O-antigen ligase family protein [Salinibacter ruber]|uniref:O-antigen ligase family protein n=1 Tax=Salinibacter ruber TaxID=146919 RepID=UPI00216825E2|nr:O-antigen ligase family protein [Salinibacter ruber]MCS4150736.1 O-antigen ligase [Salinibacter ruber]
MRISRVLPYYVGICIVSLFTGIAYETETYVLRPFDVMIGIGVLLLAANASWRGYAQRLDKGLPYYLFALLYLYRGLSGLVMTGPVLALKELLQGLEFLFLIHLVVKSTKRQRSRRQFLQTLYVGFGGIAVVTALLHIANGHYSGYKYLYYFGYTTGDAQKYAFGLFGLMALIFWARDRKNTYTFLVLMGAISLTLLSGERKGWVALAAATVAIYYVQNNFRLWTALRSAFRARYLALAGLFVIGLILAANFRYAEKQLDSLGDTYAMVVEREFDYVPMGPGRRQDVGRYNGLVFLMDALSRYPIFGVGTERRKEAVSEIPTPNVYITTGHGEYQRYALENGLIGLLLYILIWCFVFKNVLKVKTNLYLDYLSVLFIYGFMVYSVVVNMFMGGGAHNIMFLSVSVGFVVIVRNMN